MLPLLPLLPPTLLPLPLLPLPLLPLPLLAAATAHAAAAAVALAAATRCFPRRCPRCFRCCCHRLLPSAARPRCCHRRCPAVAVAAVNDNYQDDEDFAATTGQGQHQPAAFQSSYLRPSRAEGCLPLVGRGIYKCLLITLETFDPKAWFVPELPVSDWGVQTSNQVEALGSAFMRGGARSCNPTESLQIIMFSILSFFGHVRSRLHELRRRGELFLPAWPGHDKDHEHDSDVVDGYSLDVIEERIRYKVSRDGKYHVVMTPPPAQFEATARRSPFSLPIQRTGADLYTVGAVTARASSPSARATCADMQSASCAIYPRRSAKWLH